MDDEKLAFEAMMNEIGDSDSDSEFDYNEKKTPKASQNKNTHSEHDYHQSKNSTKRQDHQFNSNHRNESKGSGGGGSGGRGHTSSGHVSKNNNFTAMSKDKQELAIENFGSKPVNGGMSSSRQDKSSANSMQHSDYVANKNWLMRSCHPHDPTTLCYIVREKSMVGGLILRLYVEPKNDSGTWKIIYSHLQPRVNFLCVFSRTKIFNVS
jgi:hypothetical protein